MPQLPAQPPLQHRVTNGPQSTPYRLAVEWVLAQDCITSLPVVCPVMVSSTAGLSSQLAAQAAIAALETLHDVRVEQLERTLNYTQSSM